MRKIYSLVFILFFSFFYCQNLDHFYYLTQDFNVHSSSGITNTVYGIAIDSQENKYMVGAYQENLGLDMSKPTVFQLVSPYDGFVGEPYLVKISKDNKYLWHKTISTGNSSIAIMYSIAIDKNDNIIVAGGATGNNINLNPDSPSSPFYSTDNFLQNGIFLNKYSQNGDFIFGNFYKGGTGIPKVSIDKNDNIFLTGQYTNYFAGHNTDFDLSNNTFFLNGAHGSDFILKNDKNGNIINAKFLNGAGIRSIKFDNNDDLVILGNSSKINFNNENTFTNFYTGSTGGNYLLKVDNSISLKWFQAIGGQDNYSFIHDSQPFDIETDNSIIVSTTKSNDPVVFPNKTIQITDPLASVVIYKLDNNGHYQWHSFLTSYDNFDFINPISVFITSDHTINLTNKFNSKYKFNNPDGSIEELSNGYTYAGTFSEYTALLKLSSTGKLIYNKGKITSHQMAKADRKSNKMYFAGRGYTMDPNPDMTVDSAIPNIPGTKFGTHIQKLDKCYSATPDGDPHFYTCISETKKIKDLYPKTTYSSWYDSPTSTTPLSPDTVLETKKYYASTQDISCPFNPNRLEVDVRVFQNPPKLTVSNFTFCNLSGKRLLDLKINNNKDVDFFDDKMNSLGLGTLLEPNKKYYVRQYKSYSYYATCWSELTEFYVYDTSTPPTANSSQIFCKINQPKISDIAVTAASPKWYRANGTSITDISEALIDNTKYYVTQNSSGCESAKKEILVTLSDPNPPTGNAVQTFCSATSPIIGRIAVTGTGILWYNSITSTTSMPGNTVLKDGETYYASQTIGSCESTQRLAVKVNVLTNYLSANDFTDSLCNDTTANTKFIDIDDYKKQLITNPQDYTFDMINNLGIAVSGNTEISVGNNVFDVKIKSSLGCYQDVKLKISLDPKPKIDMRPEEEFCDDLIGVTLDAGASPDPLNSYTYNWSSGETSQTIIAKSEKTYTVTISNKFGCQNTASVIVKKAKLAEIQNILITNNATTIMMSVAGNYLYSLNEINWQSSNKFENLENGNYTVYVKTKLDCRLGAKTFTIFSLSNVFTPNGDDTNDTWKITGIESYPNSEIKIVDKHGRLVVNSITKGSFQWDGKFNGHQLPTDSYWYQIKISDGRILEGYVVIKNRN